MVKIAEFSYLIIASLFALFFITQLFIPALRNRPLLPILRHSPKADAISALGEATEQKEVEEIEKTTANILGNATTKSKRST